MIGAVTILAVYGTYSVQNSFEDVIVMFALGTLMYIGRKFGFSPAPVVLGIILGPIAEDNYLKGRMIAETDVGMFSYFFTGKHQPHHPPALCPVHRLQRVRGDQGLPQGQSKREGRKLIRETVVALCLLAGVVSLYFSLGLMEDPRSVVFPRVIILIMGVLSTLLLLQSLLVRKKPGAGQPYPFGRTILCFGIIVGYFAIMEGLGFYVSSFLFFVIVTSALGYRNLSLKKGALSLASSAVFMVVLYILFNKILAVQTPKGILF